VRNELAERFLTLFAIRAVKMSPAKKEKTPASPGTVGDLKKVVCDCAVPCGHMPAGPAKAVIDAMHGDSLEKGGRDHSLQRDNALMALPELEPLFDTRLLPRRAGADAGSLDHVLAPRREFHKQVSDYRGGACQQAKCQMPTVWSFMVFSNTQSSDEQDADCILGRHLSHDSSSMRVTWTRHTGKYNSSNSRSVDSQPRPFACIAAFHGNPS